MNIDQITKVTEQKITPYLDMFISGFLQHHKMVGKCRLEFSGNLVQIYVNGVLTGQINVERALVYALQHAIRKHPELTPARRVNLYSSQTRGVWLVELIDSDTGQQVFSTNPVSKALGLASAAQHALEEGWVVMYENHIPEIV